MLNNRGFDLWADDYDKSVSLSDEDGTYPFAGYKVILNEIYNWSSHSFPNCCKTCSIIAHSIRFLKSSQPGL